MILRMLFLALLALSAFAKDKDDHERCQKEIAALKRKVAAQTRLIDALNIRLSAAVSLSEFHRNSRDADGKIGGLDAEMKAADAALEEFTPRPATKKDP